IQALKAHCAMSGISLRERFENDSKRFSRFSLYHENDLLFDFSKNPVTEETLQLLVQMAEEAGLPEKITALFSGEPCLNITENLAVLHTALRDPATKHSGILATLARMEKLT